MNIDNKKYNLRDHESYRNDVKNIESIIRADCDKKFDELRKYAVELRKMAADDYVLVNLIEGPRRNIKLTKEQLSSIDMMKNMRVDFLGDIIMILSGQRRNVSIDIHGQNDGSVDGDISL